LQDVKSNVIMCIEKGASATTPTPSTQPIDGWRYRLYSKRNKPIAYHGAAYFFVFLALMICITKTAKAIIKVNVSCTVIPPHPLSVKKERVKPTAHWLCGYSISYLILDEKNFIG
jgi:hypothetical protein